MKKFTVSILTGNSFTFEVEANSKEDALEKAEEIYGECDGDLYETDVENLERECDHETTVHDIVEEPLYVLGEGSINGTELNKEIRQEEMHEYSIIEREDFIDELIRWIGEANDSDKALMRQDLEELLTWDDTYMLTSNSTNSYLRQGDSDFDEACKELLELNETL